MTALCHRCGERKKRPLSPCRSCGFVAVGEERGVAWLFSSAYLSEDELVLAAERIKEGEPPAPSRRLRRLGLRSLGFQTSSEELEGRRLAGLVLACLLLTPLLGLALWWGASHDQPSKARQGLAAFYLSAGILAAALAVFLLQDLPWRS